MKVVCINDTSYGKKISNLTLNKVYDVIEDLSYIYVYKVIDDKGCVGLFFKERFELLHNRRMEKIINILEE